MANSIKLAFEPFAKFKDGEPIKIIPQGTFHRGKRVLDITRQRLEEIAKNFGEGLPRFRVGINLDHAETGGKVGDVKKLAYMDGSSGPGVYATEYELSERGKKAIEQDGYDAVSAEVVWSLNQGAKYQDPETGKEHDNVLVGLALTPQPFFGHNHVALFTADIERANAVEPMGGAVSFADYDAWMEAGEQAREMGELTYVFRCLVDNVLSSEAVEDKAAAISALAGEYQARLGKKRDDMSFMQRVRKALGKEHGVGEAAEEASTIITETERLEAQMEPKVMEPEVVEPEVVEPEVVETAEEPTVEVVEVKTAEGFVAKAELEAMRAEKQRLEAELASERKDRKIAALKAEAESFKALSVRPDEFATHMLALEATSPAEAQWVREQFVGMDAAMQEAGLLKEIGSDRIGDVAPEGQFLALVDRKIKEQFNGDRAKYVEALELVTAEYPELAKAYTVRA